MEHERRYAAYQCVRGALMVLILFSFLIAQEAPILNFEKLPGYEQFAALIQKVERGSTTFVAVHEECLPQYIERLFLIAKAVTPVQANLKREHAFEVAFVEDILTKIWGVKLLFLERQATDSLFYKNINTTFNQRLILFTTPDKVRKNFKFINMNVDSPWSGFTVVVQLQGKNVVFGG